MELASAIAIAGKAIGAGLCMGIGATGPGVGEGTAVRSRTGRYGSSA